MNLQYGLNNFYLQKMDFAKASATLKKLRQLSLNNDNVSDEFKGKVSLDLGSAYLWVGNTQKALPLLTNSLSLLESAWGRDDERLDSVRDSIKRCEGMLPGTNAAASDRSVGLD